MKRIIKVNYDVTSSCFRDDAGNILGTGGYPVLYFQEQPILQLTLVAGAIATPFTDFAASALTFCAAIDNDWSHTVAPMVFVPNADINLVADWASVNPSQGKFCFKLDANTAEFETKVGVVAEAASSVFELQAFSGSDLAGVVRFPIRALNLVYAGESTLTSLVGLNYRFKDRNEFQLKDVVTGMYSTIALSNGALSQGPQEA